VSVERDSPRYPGRVGGYVSSAAVAMDNLEAVDAEYQRHLTEDAHRRRADAWKVTHSRIDTALRDYKREGSPDRRTLSDLRVIERSAARIDQRLG
jgi:hypothetical protein